MTLEKEALTKTANVSPAILIMDGLSTQKAIPANAMTSSAKTTVINVKNAVIL